MDASNYPNPEESPLINEVSEINNLPKPKKFSKILILFAILIIILIIGLFSFSFLQQNNNKAQISPLNNPIIEKMAEKLPIPKITYTPVTGSPSESSSSSLLPLPKEWKTYKNIALNFSLEYPSNLIVKENIHKFGVADISFIDSSNTEEDIIEYQLLFFPKSIGKIIGQDFDKLYTLPAKSTESMTSEASSPQLFTKIENATIDKSRAFSYMTTSNPVDPTEEAEYGVYIEFNDNILIISTGESQKTILNHMVYTFKTIN